MMPLRWRAFRDFKPSYFIHIYKIIQQHYFQLQFDALRLAFEVVQIPRESSDTIFSVLSAILWLGNLSYQVSPCLARIESKIYYLLYFFIIESDLIYESLALLPAGKYNLSASIEADFFVNVKYEI